MHPPFARHADILQRHATAFVVLALSIALAFGICLALTTRASFQDRSAEVINLPVAAPGSIFFGPYAKMQREGPSPQTPASMAARDDWTPVGKKYMTFGPLAEPIWLQARVRNTSGAPISLRFDTRRVAFTSMQLYLADADGSNAKQFLDYSYEAPFSTRPVNHRILVADVDLAPGQARTVFVRFQGIYNTTLPARLASSRAFDLADKHEIFWSAMFYGTLCAIAFLTLVSSPLIGLRISLSFAFFLATSVLTILSVEGYVDQYVVPDKTAMTARLTDTIYLVNYTALLVFSRYLFNLRSWSPRFDRFVLGAIGLVAAYSAYHFLIGIEPRPLFAAITKLVRAFCLGLHAAIGIWALFHCQNGATVFTFSAVLLTLASVFMVIDETFGFPYGGIPFTFRWLVTIEATAFAIAIIQRVVGIKRERDAGVRAELAATRERLRLSLALSDSQKAYHRSQQQARKYLRRLQTVSHDILQPLASLRGAIGRAPDQDAERNRKLEDAFTYLEALARENVGGDEADTPAHAHQHSNDVQSLPLSLVVDNVIAMFADEAASKGLVLRSQHCGTEYVVDEPLLLMRAVSNLVSNSIRFTAQGEVVVSCDVEDKAAIITVRDTGPGIEPDALDAVLRQGVKSEDSSGHGLGLAIVRRSAEKIGAVFSITSQVGHGTTARLQLPALV